MPSLQYLYFPTFSDNSNTMTANKASTSELDSGLAQLAPGTLVHSVWEDSDSGPPQEVEILAPSVGPQVPAQEVSFSSFL